MNIFFNHAFFDSTINCIPNNDRGFLLGDGLFETMRAYQGKVLFLEQHWDRLQKSAAILEIPLLFNLANISEIILNLLQRNELETKDARIRLTLTRGAYQKGIDYTDSLEPSLMLSASAYQIIPDVKNIIISTIKRNEFSPLAHIKSLNYLDNILALQEAKCNGADEALLLNTRDKLACATTGNVFMVKDNILYTPPLNDGALPGIMRKMVFDLAEKLNVEVNEMSIDLKQLKAADELFLTNSLVGVRSVKYLFNKIMPQTLTLMFAQCLSEYISSAISV